MFLTTNTTLTSLSPRKTDVTYAEKVRKSHNEGKKLNFDQHERQKTERHKERNKDRSSSSQCTVCFDVQNVYGLPLANVSNFFYKIKLSVYHLTAHCSVSKQSYGVLWSETMSGRSGNDIAMH